MNRWLTILIACATLCARPPSSAAGDPPRPKDDLVRAKLDEAKAVYDAEVQKHRGAVGDWFDKREEAARNKADQKAVDQVKAERQAFEKNGELPKSAPVGLASQLVADRARLQAAYKAAIGAYVKAKRDTDAAAVEKELDAFNALAPGQPDRKFAGNWSGSYKSTLGAKGKISLTLKEENGNYTGTWEPGITIIGGQRVDANTIRLKATAASRAYDATATILDGVMHLKYGVKREDGADYSGEAVLKQK
jgi:hypothetical protein